ncbi:hypothetical protein MBLNU457_g2879t2 [Dothideomycetes sp. NU457]
MNTTTQHDDRFKWFGEGFNGFPKRLPDDTVEYIICVIDEKLSEAAIRNRLRDIQTAANALTKKLLKYYIWQRDPFKLNLVPGRDPLKVKDDSFDPSDRQLPLPLSWTLRGLTNFGDAINDEWLIVYLLRELSKQHPDAWIKVVDNDGEFLLIEAASALPKWLNPEIAENRTWINNGQLRIIQNSTSTPAGTAASLFNDVSLEQAVSFISSSQKSLIHSQPLDDEAFFRLKDYPESISSSIHHSSTTIPRRLAYILHTKASYISPAVEAFYLRDPVSLKPLNTKDTATLNFPPEDFVTVSVKFTRVLYAQLRAQEFPPPPSWTAVRPHMQEPKVDIGMKLACGFEMMLQDKDNQDKQTVREIKLLLEDIESGDDMLPTNSEIQSWPQTQDDEKWLDINYEDLEKELVAKQGETNQSGDFGDKSTQDNLRKMVSRFETFMADEKAGLEGAENLDDMDYDDDEASTGSSELDSEGEDKDGSFNEQEFEQAMREMMGMPPDEVEKSGLLDDARKLALEMEDEEEGERDEEEEVKKIMEMMERELKGHGALNLGGNKNGKGEAASTSQSKGKAKVEDEPEELSSDDELEDNDIDLGLLKNMMDAFKGQAGMSGPASNMLASLGMNLPRDEGEDDSDDE